MPYGFIHNIEKKNYSPETVISYQKVIEQFFAYLRQIYSVPKEPFQISPTDIKNYLEEQKEKQKSASTINKELAILKTFFNYLWEIDKVPVDPAVKIKRYKRLGKLKIDITYEEILEILSKTLENAEYSSLRKAIFLLAVKGLKTAEYRFKKEDVTINHSARSQIEIKLKNRSIVLTDKEAACFHQYYEESLLNESEYVFITKPHGEDQGVAIQVMSILTHLRSISKDYLPYEAQPLTLIMIRRALAYYFFQKKYSIEMIAAELGIEANSVSNYLKRLIESR